MAATPTLLLLGSPQLQAADGACHGLPNNVPGFLAAWLALRADWAERESLGLVFWPEMAPAQALHNLRANLHRLKTWLDGHRLGDALQAEKRRVRLRLHCDVHDFRKACGAARWGEALALRRGPFLQSASLPGMPGVDEWLHAQRQALDAAWREAALRQADAWMADGRTADAAALLQHQLEHDLLAEDVLQALLRAAPQAGCSAQALALHERFVQALAGSLGQAPLPATQGLAAALRLAAEPAAPQPRRGLPARLAAPALVGREQDVERLRAACAAPGLVVLRGEPGVGKTRLAEAVLPRALWWACREADLHTPLAPVAEYLQDSLHAWRELPAAQRHAAWLGGLVPALRPPGAAAESLSSPAGGQALQAGLVELLHALDRPLVIDDLQWADAQTLALAAALLRAGRLTVLATLRPQPAASALSAWLDAQVGEGRARVLPLAPLDEAATALLVAGLSGQPGGAPRFAHWLHARSAGNPLLALESLRALFAQGRLTEDAQGWHSVLDDLSAGYEDLALPPQVAEVVRLRLSALGEATQRVLRVCAVAGHALWLEPLAQVSGLSAMALGESLGEAQQASVLHGRRFAHELLRQAVLEAMPEALRAATHAAWLRHAAAWLEPHARAVHAWAAGDVPQAVLATREAARLDAQRGLHDAADALLTGALQRLAPLDAQRAGLHAQRAGVWMQQARLDEALAEAALALAELPEPADRALALATQADVALQQGRLADVPALVDAALEAVPAHADAWMIRMRWSHAQGDFAAAEHTLRERLAALRRERPGPDLVVVLTSLGSTIDFLGRHAEALALHREALALARRLGARYAEVVAALNLLWCLPELGLHDEAIALGERTLALGEFDTTPTLANNLAYLYLLRGRPDDAARLYEQLAAGPEPTLACVAQAKLMQIHAEQGRQPAAALAAETLLQRIPGTEHAQAHAIAVLALLDHGPVSLRDRALEWLPRQPVDAELQVRLETAVARARAR